MVKRVSIVFLYVLVLAGCAPAGTATSAAPGSGSTRQTLNVFAAASLSDAFTEIGKNFESAHPGTTVSFNFAGSQALRTQIEEGAPADVFASANQTEMDALAADGIVTPASQHVFLTNRLVVILPRENPARLEKLEDLARPGLKLVFAAEEVPAGKYTRQMLDKLNNRFGDGFKEKVLANIVSNEDNVRQVVAKVQLGEADGGIVYTSDAVAAPGLKAIEIPADVNVIAKYPIAVLAKSPNAGLANDFLTYVLSKESQAVLQKWGFAPP
ncbi:MAG: molybdate ABC transporter substrate-binding protein [Syntrophothermus sp.]